MPRPLGSKNKPKPLALSSAPGVIVTDGYANALTGTGTRKDSSSYTRMLAPHILQEPELNGLYIGDGFARKIVDIPPEEMTRSGVELKDLDNPEMEQYVFSRIDELDLMRHANDAVRWSRLAGGSVMVLGLNDGGTLDVPLNDRGIKDVEFVRVYDRWQATISTRVTDPQSIDYGKPELWQISPKAGGSPYTVHNSRLIMFDGDSVPDMTRQSNLGWGVSVLQSCHTELTRLGMSHKWAGLMMERSQQAVHKIPNLSNILRAPGGEDAIRKRVDVVDMVRTIINTIVTDSEESYDILTQSMTGIPDVMDRFSEALSAVSGIPVSILMGRTQGGLNSTDKGSMDSWYARVEAMWNDVLRKPLDRIITYIIAAKYGAVPEYSLCMKPLNVLSDKEQAEIDQLKANANKAQAEADAIYLTNSVIDQDEIRTLRAEAYGIVPGSAAPEPEPEPAAPVVSNGF